MAHKKFGARPPEWWKHLRWQKRPAEKRVRTNARKHIKEEL